MEKMIPVEDSFERGSLKIHYYKYPNPGKPLLVGLHGYNDTGRTFEFLLPFLARHFELIFPDWRGHGFSGGLTDGYYNPTILLGDLAKFTGELRKPYHLLGHSMGASAAARFAGIFPEEIASLVLFEGFVGLSPVEEEQRRLKSWLTNLRQPRPKKKLRVMKSKKSVMEMLSIMHPALNEEKLEVLSGYLARPLPEGGFVWHYDPDFRSLFSPLPFPPLLSRQLWESIACPTMILYGTDTHLRPGGKSKEEIQKKPNPELEEILGHFKHLEYHEIEDAGHNMHHDRPEEVIHLMENFYKKHSITE